MASSSSHSRPKPFYTVFDPSKPVEFLDKALYFLAKESDFFNGDSLMIKVNALVTGVKDRLIAEERFKQLNSNKATLTIRRQTEEKEVKETKSVDDNGDRGVCNNSPLNCPYAPSKCTVTGDITYLVKHMRDDHKANVNNGCTINKRYVNSDPHGRANAIWASTVFHCYNEYFCLHFEAFQLGTAPVYIAFLRFMGDENEACKYGYRLEVGGNGTDGLIWEGRPRSIRESLVVKVRDSLKGLIIPRDLALFFSGGDNNELNLIIRGRIWKEADITNKGISDSKPTATLNQEIVKKGGDKETKEADEEKSDKINGTADWQEIEEFEEQSEQEEDDGFIVVL